MKKGLMRWYQVALEGEGMCDYIGALLVSHTAYSILSWKIIS